MNDPLQPETLADMLAAHRAGRPVEATIAGVYARIAALADPAVFISLKPQDDALAQARRLDASGARDLPLFGVPVAVKDNIDVAGLPTTAACAAFSHMPLRSATVVERLVAAGAIVIGKTNLDQFATGLVGVRSPYGVPRNAVDPRLVPGGSSSGSAVAVAAGLVPVALGTDTAGSGRVPAGLNRIVGLKPSLGAFSTHGVVPACRSLDCVSVFALTVDDAHTVARALAAPDPRDAFSRNRSIGPMSAPPPAGIFGVPRAADLTSLDAPTLNAWQAACRSLARTGARLVEIDLGPFLEVAALLYGGPWVAERTHAVADLLTRDPAALHPVTRAIVARGHEIGAVETFDAFYRLRALASRALPALDGLDALLVPTAPFAPTLADLEADPIGPNSRLGTFTNFVNLLDLCALAVPGPDRADGIPAGVTLIAPAGHDARLASLGRDLQALWQPALGATGLTLKTPAPLDNLPDGFIELAVVGAHLSGLPLNRDLVALGAVFRRAVETALDYRFYALPGGPPFRPGLVRVATGTGASIAAEIWALPADGFGRFVASIPAPLGIGTLRLADGGTVKGFLCEAEAVRDARDISAFGGWRAFMAAGTQAAE
jgi:allophanate hydrolase